MEIFYLSILCEFVRDTVLFGSFLVDVRDHYDPSLDSWQKGLFRVVHGVPGGKDVHRAALVSAVDSTRSNF